MNILHTISSNNIFFCMFRHEVISSFYLLSFKYSSFTYITASYSHTNNTSNHHKKLLITVWQFDNVIVILFNLLYAHSSTFRAKCCSLLFLFWLFQHKIRRRLSTFSNRFCVWISTRRSFSDYFIPRPPYSF